MTDNQKRISEQQSGEMRRAPATLAISSATRTDATPDAAGSARMGKPANRPSDVAFVGLLAVIALMGTLALLASVAASVRPDRRRSS